MKCITKFTSTSTLMALSLVLTGCNKVKITPPLESNHNLENIQTSIVDKDTTRPVDKAVLHFAENEVGIETNSFVENVYILNTKSNNRIILDKPDVLKNRPIDDLKKIDSNTFSFIISTSPHFAQFFKYNLQGQSIIGYPIADECYYLESFPPEVQDKAKAKCQNNPEFKTFEESLNKLKSE